MAHRVIVVGAGIAGLSTAVALHRGGHLVTVFEERSDTSSGAGISIWPNALAALDRIGLGDQVREAGGRISAGAVRWRDGTWIRRPSAQRIVTALGEPLVVIERAILRDILAGALPAGTVEHGVALTAVEHTAAGVRADLADGSRREADALVGADGTYSVVARLPQRRPRAALRRVPPGAGWPTSGSIPTWPARRSAWVSSSAMCRWA